VASSLLDQALTEVGSLPERHQRAAAALIHRLLAASEMTVVRLRAYLSVPTLPLAIFAQSDEAGAISPDLFGSDGKIAYEFRDAVGELRQVSFSRQQTIAALLSVFTQCEVWPHVSVPERTWAERIKASLQSFIPAPHAR
jgi:hypothetical protein